METSEKGSEVEFGEDSFAARLLKHGCSPDAVNPDTGDSLLHLAARQGFEAAAMFLAANGAKVNVANSKVRFIIMDRLITGGIDDWR